MSKTIHGKVRGNSIELDENLGLADSQDVEVQVRTLPPAKDWGSGIIRTAGALADDPYWDNIMEEVHRARKLERRPPVEQS